MQPFPADRQSINPQIQQSTNPIGRPSTTPPLPAAAATPRDPEPWPEPVDGNLLLNKLVRILSLFVVLPKWAAETLALWILHTYAFHLRDVTTYIGLESRKNAAARPLCFLCSMNWPTARLPPQTSVPPPFSASSKTSL